MATNIPLTGKFKVTCIYHKKGNNWSAGWHTGIDLIGSDNIYSSCNGQVVRTGFDTSYGNFIVVKNHEDGKYHWFCHLSKIYKKTGQEVLRTTVIGKMGSTGNVTGKHLHFEIRNSSNKYNDNSNPATYMGIPNKVGWYNSSNFQINKNELKTLNHNTNLRKEPNTSSEIIGLFIPNTTVYVLQKNVAKNNGYTWDKVKIRVTGDIGYMINCNYKE